MGDKMFIYYNTYALVIWICAMKLFFAYVKAKVIRIGLGVVYSIIVIPVLLLSLLITFFSIIYYLHPHEPHPSFGSRTVIKSELSPNSAFLAEIIDVDEGALGGNTLVDVTPLNSDLNIFIGTLKKNPRRIYEGRWGEFRTMTLRWEGNKVLYINEKQYVVSF
jgi:hypothetical protein